MPSSHPMSLSRGSMVRRFGRLPSGEKDGDGIERAGIAVISFYSGRRKVKSFLNTDANEANLYFDRITPTFKVMVNREGREIKSSGDRSAVQSWIKGRKNKKGFIHISERGKEADPLGSAMGGEKGKWWDHPPMGNK